MEELFIPATGMAMEDAELIEWLVQPGEPVAAGDAVAVIETDKATVDIVAETSGVLGPHLCAEGERVSAGATIGHVLQPGEQPPGAAEPAVPPPAQDAVVPDDAVTAADPAPAEEPVTSAATEAPAVPEVPVDPMSVPWDGERRPHRESPRARAGHASGAQPPAVPAPAAAPAAATPAGAVPAATPTVPPVAPAAPPAAVSPAPAPAPAGRDAKAVAALVRAVTDSWRTVPHFTVAREIDVTGFLAYREYLRAAGSEATMTDILLQAAQRAWRAIRPESAAGVGLAVATTRRVINVSIPDAGDADIDRLASSRRAAVERARNGKLRPADYTPVEVTVSNLGASGVDFFTGVIPPGQLALITIGRPTDRLELHEGVVRARKVMWVCATLDHRTLDGVHGAELLEAFQAAGQVRLHDPSEGA